MTIQAVEKADNRPIYEKDFPILNNTKKRNNGELDKSAEKTAKVAKETSKNVTTTASWKQLPDTQQLQTQNEELTTQNEDLNFKNKELAAKIEELAKELNISQNSNKDLSAQVEQYKNKANVLEVEIEELKGANSLTSSAIVSTEVKQSVSELQKQLSSLAKDIEAEVKTADAILSATKEDENEFFTSLSTKLENFDQQQNIYQSKYAQREQTFRHTIEQRNSTAIYWNQGGLALSDTVQGTKYLNLLNQNYGLMTDLNTKVKKLQTAYETLVKNEYRNESAFKDQVLKVDEKITQPEERIGEAKADYANLDENIKKELLKEDYKELLSHLNEIRDLKSKLTGANESEKKSSAIKLLFETIESEIKNSSCELSKNALDKFEVFRPAIESELKETLTKNAKFHHDIYTNMRKWASPVWNETLNYLKILETEIQLLKERTFIHEIMVSYNVINKIKGLSQQNTETIQSLTKSYEQAKPALRVIHVKYYDLIDSYNERIASLKAKISDLEGEKALKQDLEEYSINSFTTKKIVTADLIKSLTKQLNLVTQQKTIIEGTWAKLLQRIFDTSNDLLALKVGGKITVQYVTGNFTGTNIYVPIHSELSYKPVKQKTELLTKSATG